MEVCRILPVIERSDAVSRLDRLALGGRLSWRRWLRAPLKQSVVTCCWLPCRQVRFQSEEDASAGFLLVNGFARQAALMLDPPPIEAVMNPDEIAYPLTDLETLAIARRTFLNWRLNRAARTTRDSEDFVVGSFWLYPYWVQTTENQRGRMGLELVDGVTGRPAGLQVKQAYLDALRFRAERKTRHDTSSS